MKLDRTYALTLLLLIHGGLSACDDSNTLSSSPSQTIDQGYAEFEYDAGVADMSVDDTDLNDTDVDDTDLNDTDPSDADVIMDEDLVCEEGMTQRVDRACGAQYQRCQIVSDASSPSWVDIGECCPINESRDQACGPELRGTQSATCTERSEEDGLYWRATTECVVVSECESGEERVGDTACGLNSQGVLQQRCIEGVWSDSEDCIDDDVCTNGEQQNGSNICGLNGQGMLLQNCVEGAWVESEECGDDDVCVNGEQQDGATLCGPNGLGVLRQDCVDGSWIDNETCIGDGVCINGEVLESDVVCGLLEDGVLLSDCVDGAWVLGEECNGTDVCADLGAYLELNESAPATPPFWGTIFVNSQILTPEDPSAFNEVTYVGQAIRTMYDRRPANWIQNNAHIFNASFGTNTTVEIQVNSEFTQAEALLEANKYGFAIGQLPAFLMVDVDTVWIHRGVEGFGGGNRNLLIHTGQGELYIQDGILEETFIHEATHTSFDAYHRGNPLWLDAQNLDGMAISRYALDFPNREDLAETMPLYLAVRFWADRIPSSLYDTIMETIPNRIRYLDCANLSIDILQ